MCVCVCVYDECRCLRAGVLVFECSVCVQCCCCCWRHWNPFGVDEADGDNDVDDDVAVVACRVVFCVLLSTAHTRRRRVSLASTNMHRNVPNRVSRGCDTVVQQNITHMKQGYSRTMSSHTHTHQCLDRCASATTTKKKPAFPRLYAHTHTHTEAHIHEHTLSQTYTIKETLAKCPQHTSAAATTTTTTPTTPTTKTTLSTFHAQAREFFHVL